MPFTSVVRFASLAVVGALFIGACSGGPTDNTISPPTGGNSIPFSSLAIAPTAPSVVVGQTAQVMATFQAAAGATITVSYASLNAAVATVNSSGVVSGVSAGTAEIRATVIGSGTGFTPKQETVSAIVTVTSVSQGAALVSLTVTPAAHSLSVGSAVQLTPVPVTASAGVNVTYTYQTSSAAIATVTGGGVVTGASAGQATITVQATGSGAGFTTTVRQASVAITVGAANGFTGAVELTAGLWNTCARAANNTMWCWGAGFPGNGLPGSNNAYTPAAPSFPVPVSVTAMTAGWNNYCALTASSGMYCWGQVVLGGIGNGTTGDVLTPALIAAPQGTSYREVTAGWVGVSCALTTANRAYCWGDNNLGSVGDGTTVHRLTPAAVQMPAGVTFSSISAGFLNVCAVSTSQAIYCWGGSFIADFVGLPPFSTTPIVPTQVVTPAGVTFARVATGNIHDCALSTSGDAYCHGAANFGALGNGYATGGAHQNTFVKATMPTGITFTSIGVGTEHSCALANNGSAYCWGRNRYGAIGDGTFFDRTVPTLVKLPGVVLAGIAVGREHNCGWTSAGAVYCWGRNQYGQLGDVSKVDRSEPYRFR